MVLGLRSKNRRGNWVQVNYLIHVQEIKPWPPSDSLKSAQSLLLHWENGDHGSGSFSCNVRNGKIECGESFRLPVTLKREASKKSTSNESFQKNYLVFYLYEFRKDMTTKGQHLGSAVINLADYGIINDTITISCPMSFKKSSKSMVQSVLYVDIQAWERVNSSLLKEGSLDKDGSECVSEATNEGNDDRSEFASFTDDDVDDVASSHSSHNVSSVVLDTIMDSTATSYGNGSRSIHGIISNSAFPTSKLKEESTAATFEHLNETSAASSIYASSNEQNSVDVILANISLSDDHVWAAKKSTETANNELHVSLMKDKGDEEKQDSGWNGLVSEVQKDASEDYLCGNLPLDDKRKKVGLRSNTLALNRTAGGQGATRRDKLRHLKSVQIHYNSSENDELISSIDGFEKARKIDIPANVPRESRRYVPTARDTRNISSSIKIESRSEIEVVQEEEHNNAAARFGSLLANDDEMSRNVVQLKDKPKHIDHTGTSVESSGDQAQSNSKGVPEENKGELETKVEMLEEELMEAAAVEAGFYSVVAEHGSSMNKVHASARRLSRFYLHACKTDSPARRENAARAIISGLVLVCKACGNDVPRLTFWLSNAIVLRVIASQAVDRLQVTSKRPTYSNGHKKVLQESYLHQNGCNTNSFDDQMYITALVNVESWIFSRIIESIWWQTLTPHMQSTAVKGSRAKKHHAKSYGLGGQEQGNLAIELWINAFKDACERLCPIRAGGHDCGCLPFLPRLVMEQLVVRLDVAMFNAILRESDDEMPTDPVSDPISDLKVLPIPAGRLSFGAGAQLKNAVGSWSRWLTDLFGIDENEGDENGHRSNPNKAFRLLNALSDLMMLPFEVLADSSTRKEVCPIFGAPVIKQVLYNFVPDEFNPEPIPDTILDSLDLEDPGDAGDETVASFPCIAAPITYIPPSAASLSPFMGEVGNQSLQRSELALLRASYTSDDELDELESPMTAVVIDKSRFSNSSAASSWLHTGKGSRRVVRFQLLRNAWKGCD